MNTKQISTLVIIALFLLSAVPAFAQHDLITAQSQHAAALVTDIMPDEVIFVQYLGDKYDAQLHVIYYDGACEEEQDYNEEVTPLQIVRIDGLQGLETKVVIVVENSDGSQLINDPLLGVKYGNDFSTAKALSGITAPSIAPGAEFGDAGTLHFDGSEYGLFPLDFIYLPFLTDANEVGTTVPQVDNRMHINTFDPEDDDVDTFTFNDDEDNASSDIELLEGCAGITSLLTANGYQFSDIGQNGILQGFPLATAQAIAGAGVIRSINDEAVERIYGEASIVSGVNPFEMPITQVAPSDAITNLFFPPQQGTPFELSYTTLPIVMGAESIFNGLNENYQNPLPSSALTSIGVQYPTVDVTGSPLGTNRETIFAIHNTDTQDYATVKLRWDFINLDPSFAGDCDHQDFSFELSPGDVEYVRVSELTNILLEGMVDAPIIGVLTAWDTESQNRLIGYRWDIVSEITTECDDGIDNDNDGGIDYFGNPADQDCDDEFDDDESGDNNDRVDKIRQVDSMGDMLTIDATLDSQGRATFAAAKTFTTIVPTLGTLTNEFNLDSAANYNLIVVNWEQINNPTAPDRIIDFQVTDDLENVQSAMLESSCISLYDSQDFGDLANGIAFGTDPAMISITGEYAESAGGGNAGLAAFVYFDQFGLGPDIEVTEDAGSLAFMNAIHGGEVFETIDIQPGSVPGDQGGFEVEIGLTPSVNLNDDVTVSFYATTVNGNLKEKGPLICTATASVNVLAGEAFGVIVTGCPVDPLNMDTILRVQTMLGTLGGPTELLLPN